MDIGNPITWSRKDFLKHLFKRIFAIGEERIEDFYQRHLNYYLAEYPTSDEELFFRYLWELVERQLKVLSGKDIYDKNHVRNEMEIKRLKEFTSILITHDKWSLHKSTEAVVAAQEIEIYALNQKIIQLTADVAEYRQFDGYILIRDGQALALLDLCIKMPPIVSNFLGAV